MEKPKLTIEQQIDHMEKCGINFNIINKETALQYITNNTYYFKIKAFAKNYDKNSKGQYVNLDFAYLKELSVIDMHLRKLILSICLQIEHYLKVDINRHFSSIKNEDGYSIVRDFQNSDFYINTGGYKSKAKSHYNEDLINKYENNYAIWNFMEVITFGELIELYKFYYQKYDLKKAKIYNYLYCVKHLRNASAHSNCLLNNIRKTIVPNKSLVSFLKNKTNISKSIIDNKSNKIVVNDFVALLYCFFEVVSSDNVKQKVKLELKEFVCRIRRNIVYFKLNDEMLSMINFFEAIINFFDING